MKCICNKQDNGNRRGVTRAEFGGDEVSLQESADGRGAAAPMCRSARSGMSFFASTQPSEKLIFLFEAEKGARKEGNLTVTILL